MFRPRMVSVRLVGLLLLGMLASLALAQASIGVAEHDDHGSYLVDSEGMSLYMFLPDAEEEGRSTCYDDCAEAWPPLTTEEETEAFKEVDADLLGTIEREDGAQQVTYDGWPLYYFVQDEEAGDVAGQRVGDSWYLVSPEGEAIGADASANESDSAGVEELIAEGRALYNRGADPTPCAECHGEDGQGANGPTIVDSRIVPNSDRFIRRVLSGGQLMPAYGRSLSDREVAAVTTYVRNSFGYELDPITGKEVSEMRR